MKGWNIDRIKATGLTYKIIGSGEKVPGIEVEVPKRGKYGNVRIEIDGIKFDSTKEGERYKVLRLLEKRGIIQNLRCHVKYLLITNIDVKYTFSYECDFAYTENGVEVIEDVKPYDKVKGYLLTPLFKKKKKLMRCIYGIEIKIV